MEKVNEIWKSVVGYEGQYEVSNIGRVRSLNYRGTRKTRLLKLILLKNGYLKVTLYKKEKQYYVHRLVAQAFIPNPNNLSCVNHKNEIRVDNRAENLEWCTYLYNLKYSDIIEKVHELKKKPILQYTKTGKLITEYESASEASRQTGINCGNICSCGRGKCKSAGGYIWKYKN